MFYKAHLTTIINSIKLIKIQPWHQGLVSDYLLSFVMLIKKKLSLEENSSK